jgi:hypothetical protein
MTSILTILHTSILPFMRQDTNESVNKSFRYVNIILRFILFLTFIFICFQFVYLPQQTLGRANIDLSVKSIMAANKGLPFYFEFPPPQGFLTFNELPYQEMGIYILNSIISTLGRVIFGNTFQLPLDASVKIVLGLMILTSFLFLSPVVPLFISIGGNIALIISLFTGAISLYDPASLWGATYGAILTFMMLGISFTVGNKWKLHILAHIFLLAVLASISKYFREEVTILIFGSAFLVLAIVLLIKFVAFNVERRNKIVTSTNNVMPLYPLVYCLFFVTLVYISQFAVRGLYALAWDVSYSDTKDSIHGSGHALLLSLGYIENPYNLAWSDNVGPQQTQLRLSSPSELDLVDNVFQVKRQLYEQPDYQARAGNVAWMIIRENPILLLKNILARANDIFSWLFTPNAIYPYQLQFSPAYIVFSPFVLVLAVLNIMLMLFTAWKLLSVRALCLSFIAIGFVGLSLVSPLIIHAFYVSAFRGAVYSCGFILLGACLTLWLEKQNDNRIIVRRIINYSSMTILGLVISTCLVIGSIINILDNRYQHHLQSVSTADPVSELISTTYHFADDFNALDLQQQEVILGQLRQSPNIHVFEEIVSQSDPEHLLSASQVFTHGQYIYVVTKLGVNNHLSQDTDTSTILRISTSCDLAFADIKFFSFDDCKLKLPIEEQINLTTPNFLIQQWLINDHAWNSENYRMFALPVSSKEFINNLTTLTVGLYDYSPFLPLDQPYTPEVYYVLKLK